MLSILIFSGCQENTSDPTSVSNDDGSLSKGGKVIDNVTGSGNFVSNGNLRVFTFNARSFADGSVDGHFNLNRTNSGVHISGSITCFNINGNEAYFGGIIENSNSSNPNFGPGASSWFAVMDNGQGNNSDPDQISLSLNSNDPFYDQTFLEQFCADPSTVAPLDNPISYGWNDVESGNIKIH
ncbi:hypothetical protein ACFLSH_00160 [Bacteroidota bacterium]